MFKLINSSWITLIIFGFLLSIVSCVELNPKNRNLNLSQKPSLDVKFSLGSLKTNLTWQSTIPPSLKNRYLIIFSLNFTEMYNFYITKSNVDYMTENVNITSSKDIDECHEKCYSNFACVAYSYVDRQCVLKFDKQSPTKCSKDFTCHTIPDFSNNVQIDLALNSIYSFFVSISSFNDSTEYSDESIVNTTVQIDITKKGLFEEHKTNTLICGTGVADDLISYTWLKDGHMIDEDFLNITIEKQNLLFFNDLDHFKNDGFYTCEIEIKSTKQRIQSKSVLIQVLHDPLISIDPVKSVLRYNESDSLNLTCFIDGTPTEYGVWFQRPKLSKSKTNSVNAYNSFSIPKSTITYSSYFITKLKNSDTGTYSCCLKSNTNLCKSLDVIVQTRPSKPTIINASYFTDTKLCYLQWLLPFDGDAPINRLTIFYEAPNNSSQTKTREFLLNEENKNELYLRDLFDETSLIKIKLGNIFDYGDLSDFSTIERISPMSPIPSEIIAAVAFCFVLVIVLVVVFLRRYEIIEQKKLTKRYNNLEMDSVTENNSQQNIYMTSNEISGIRIRNEEDNPSSSIANENSIDQYKHEETIGRSHSLKELNDNSIDSVKNNYLDENIKLELSELSN